MLSGGIYRAKGLFFFFFDNFLIIGFFSFIDNFLAMLFYFTPNNIKKKKKKAEKPNLPNG